MNNSDTCNPATGNFCNPANPLLKGLSTAHIRPQAYDDYIGPLREKAHIGPQHYEDYIGPLGENRRDKPLMKDTDEGYAYVSSAVGGSVSSISFKDSSIRNRTYKRTDCSGSVRGTVKGFSRVSRRNLLRRLASINRTAFRSFKGRLISVTLTYPGEYPEDPEVCKSHLKAFQKRLKRRYGEFAAFWRMGIQRRGAFHFHLLLFVPPSVGRIDTLRRFVSSSWYEVCGEVSEVHLQVGTRVEQIRKWKKVTSYAERYLAKEEEFPSDMETGRIWGIWNEKFLPIEWETVKVSLRDAYKIRRVFRKLAKRRGSGSLRRLTVFVRHENMVRLLQFLGYCLE